MDAADAVIMPRTAITNDLAPADLSAFDLFADAGVALSLPVTSTARAVMVDAEAILRAGIAGKLALVNVEEALPPAAVETLGRAVPAKVKNGAVLSGSPMHIIARMGLLADKKLLPSLREVRLVGKMATSDLVKFTPAVLALLEP